VNLQSLLPFGTDRRLALQLLRDGVTSPGTLRHRVNRENLAEWRRFRDVRARCNLCGHHGTLLHELPDLERFRRHRIRPLRETLRCRGCLAKMRDRTVAAGLLDVLADRFGVVAETIVELAGRLPAGVRVLDTDANSRMARLLSRSPGYTVSLFQPEHENGAALSGGAVNVDLEHIPFPDRSFDIVITTEVMEHVRHVDTAHREIARCLDDGGTYLFTVPYDASLAQTWRLIDPETDEPLVRPMHMHGDPGLREEGIKSYRVFGRDIVADLHDARLDARFVSMERHRAGIFAGDLFLATRL
jgi:SAM-dependent methyltransferase